MKNKIIFLFIVLAFFLCGCWNYQELNEIAIVTGFAIDKEEDQLMVSLLISNAKQSSSSSSEGEAQTSIYTGKGNTLSDALADIELEMPRQLYLGHISVVIVSKQVAENGVDNIIDFLMRSPESRKKFYFVLSENQNAKDILKILSPLEGFPSQNITTNIKISSQMQATSTDVYLSDFVSKTLSNGVNPILTTIHTEGDIDQASTEASLQQSEPFGVVALGPIAIFRKDKLVGVTDVEESIAINLINNKVYQAINEIADNIVIRIEAYKTCKEVVFENQKPTIQIHVKVKGAIDEINEDINIQKPEEIARISKMAEEYYQNLIEKAIEATQNKYRSDVFGFGSMIYKKNPTYFKKVEEEWDDYFYPSLKIETKVSVNLHSKGSLEQTLKEKANEKNK